MITGEITYHDSPSSITLEGDLEPTLFPEIRLHGTVEPLIVPNVPSCEEAVEGLIINLKYYRTINPLGRPYIPVEFSVAAYRFGHSIARPATRCGTSSIRGPAAPWPCRASRSSRPSRPTTTSTGTARFRLG